MDQELVDRVMLNIVRLCLVTVIVAGIYYTFTWL